MPIARADRGQLYLPLFPKPGPPAWWTECDSEVCREFHRQESRPMPPVEDAAAWEALDLHPRWREYTCRQCRGWVSSDGANGLCMTRYIRAVVEREACPPEPNPSPDDFPDFGHPEPGHYETGAGSMCEEWTPRDAARD